MTGAAAAPAPGGGPVEHHGLRPRPEPDPLVAALVAAAVDQLRPAVAVTEPPGERHLAWRFSGRWWSRPLPARRDRPWLH